jgi:hypothetical protein
MESDASHTTPRAEFGEQLVDIRRLYRSPDRSREHQSRLLPPRPRVYTLRLLTHVVAAKRLDPPAGHCDKPG